jgi:hypothetical protein
MRAMATSLSLDRYAEVQAELAAGRLRDDVLARAGLSIEEWASAHEWLDQMAAELTLGGFELTNRYTHVFLERQRAFAAPAQPAPAPKRAPASLTRTMTGSVLPKEPALPFSPGSPAAEPAVEPPKMLAVHRAPAALTGTSTALIAPKGPALPFAPAGSSTSPTSPGPAPAPPLPATPTGDDHREPIIAAVGEPSPWIADVEGTFVGESARSQPALPFDPDAPSPLAARTDAPVPVRAPSELGGTLDATVAPPDAPVPFKPAASAAAPPAGLSLEQYASLLVELAVEPTKTDEILRRYGITAEQREAIDGYWQRRMGADPKTWMAFDRAYAAYRAWYVTAREKGDRSPT